MSGNARTKSKREVVRMLTEVANRMIEAEEILGDLPASDPLSVAHQKLTSAMGTLQEAMENDWWA